VPLLRYADLESDADLVEMARAMAEQLLRDAPERVTSICSAGWAAARKLLKA